MQAILRVLEKRNVHVARKYKDMTIEEILAVKKCTKCGKSFKKGDGRFPYPKKQVLCKKCFHESLHVGLNRLNKVLAGESPVKIVKKKTDKRDV